MSTTRGKAKGTMRFRIPGAAAMLFAAALLAGCEDDIPAVFAPPGGGAVEGFLYFDADRNGKYDPSAGDIALPNVTVNVYERGDTTKLATPVATNSQGRFSFEELPVGTHTIQVDTTGLTAQHIFFCQNPVQVTVQLNETNFREFIAKGGCVITIAEAEKSAPGSFVTVTGIVTTAPNQFTTSGNWYIEDRTGGAQIFRVDLGGRTIQVGDSVEVSGTLGSYATELEIMSPGQVNTLVEDVRIPVPLETTTAVLAAATDPKTNLQGRLVVVRHAQQTTAFAEGAGRNALFDDGSGPVTVRVESGVVSNAANLASYTPGKCYDVTGILRVYNSVAQLTPRMLSDLAEVACQ